jgi:hypothetical protein
MYFRPMLYEFIHHVYIKVESSIGLRVVWG